MSFVVTALIKNPSKDKFLIVKRKPTASVHPKLWSFPGGKIKKGEDILTALKREINEETSLSVQEDFKQLSEYTYERPNKEITYGLCFSCTATTENVHLNHELEDYRWITPREFLRYSHIKGLEKEVKKAFKQ